MSKLRYLFMTLSALCFATPAFAQGGEASDTHWIAITAGFSMAIASAVCGLAQGKAVARGHRVPGPQPRRPSRNPVRPDSGLGPDRVPSPLHPGDHLPEGKVSKPQPQTQKPLPASRGFCI